MRLIPGKIKVKIELFKGVTAVDIAIGIVTFGLLMLVITSSLPRKAYIAGGIALIACGLLLRMDSEPNYQYLLHILRFLFSRKRFKRNETDRDFLIRNQEEEGGEELPETVQEQEELPMKETAKEKKARIKAEDKLLKDKNASQEEKDAILERRRAASIAAARKIAEAKDATMHREPIKRISAFTDIRDGYLEYGGQYFGAAIEIPPIEFRFFNDSRRNNSIENGVGRILRSLPPEYSANLVKIERPILYDDYLAQEYAKLDDLRASYEQGMIRENELQARVEIIYDRINDLRNLCFGDKVVEAFFYLVLFDSDKRQLDILVNTEMDSLRSGEMNPKRLDSKELAVFMKYTNEIDFDEREIERIAPEDYAKWAMPKIVDVKSRTVEINHIVTHNMRLSNYPTSVSDAWLAGVASMPGTKVVVKFRPMDRSKAMRGIDRSLQELRGQWNATSVDSRLVELEEHISTLSSLLTMLQGDNETLLETNIYVTSYDIATTRARVNAVQPPRSSRAVITNMKKSVRRLYQEAGFRTNGMDFTQFDAYVGSQVSGYDPMQSDARGIPSNTLAASFPWIFATVSDPNGVKIGASDGTPVFLDFFRRDSERVNSNMVIVGKSGSGKSYATKSLLANLAADGAKIFILDPENEYTELAANLHGKFINVGNAQYGRLNPFHIISALDDDEGGGTISGSYATHLQFLEEFFRQLLPDCDKDALEYLNSLINRMYFARGISEDTDLSRLRPEDYPIFDDLYDVILKEFQATDNDYIHTMLRTLMNYIAKFSIGGRNANIWDGPSTITTEENFTVFNFQSLLANRNSTIANSQMLLVLKYIDNEIIKNRDYNTKYHMNRKIVVVIDEAHVFIDTKFPVALDFMFQLAKRIRKYNGMQIVITQNIKDFVGSEEIARKSTAIINACQYSFIFALSPNDMDDLCKLYEKAGGINESEQDQIVRAARGQAFAVLSPQSRSTFRIVVPQEVAQMFSEQGFVSNYFTGEQGAVYWEDFIGGSREKRDMIQKIAEVQEQVIAEETENPRSKVVFRELDEEAEELLPVFDDEQSIAAEKPAPIRDMEASLAAADEAEAEHTAPLQFAAAPQVIVQNDNSRMEAMLGELLNKLTKGSVMNELRESIREEVLREIAAAGITAAQMQPPAFAAQEQSFTEEQSFTDESFTPEFEPFAPELEPFAPEEESFEPVALGNIFASLDEDDSEFLGEAADDAQTDEDIFGEADAFDEDDEEDGGESLSVSQILQDYLRSREEDKPSVIDLMLRYHDTVVNISLEELAYHNSKQREAS